MDQAQARLNRSLRMSLILEIIEVSGKTGTTMDELAEQGGLKRSPYLAQIVRDLISLGCIGERLERNHTGRAVAVFLFVKPYEPA